MNPFFDVARDFARTVLSVENQKSYDIRNLFLVTSTNEFLAEIQLAEEVACLLDTAGQYMDNYQWAEAQAMIDKARDLHCPYSDGEIVRAETLLSFLDHRTVLDGLAEIAEEE
mgnify:CR=1 FL=1